MKREEEEEKKNEKGKEKAFGLRVVKPEIGICNHSNWPWCGFDLVSSEAPRGSNLRENTV